MREDALRTAMRVRIGIVLNHSVTIGLSVFMMLGVLLHIILFYVYMFDSYDHL